MFIYTLKGSNADNYWSKYQKPPKLHKVQSLDAVYSINIDFGARETPPYDIDVVTCVVIKDHISLFIFLSLR